MQSTGIIRKCDDLGRVVIPKELIRALQYAKKQPIEISLKNQNNIIVKKISNLIDIESGVVRKIDELNRIVIPKSVRKRLSIQRNTEIEIFLDENKNIILIPMISKCIICKTRKGEFFTSQNEKICGECIDWIKQNL